MPLRPNRISLGLTTSTWIRLWALVITLVAIESSICEAQERATACEDITACRERFAAAQRLAKARDDDQALQKFMSLYAEYRDPRLLVPLARMLDRAGRYEEARAFYQRFILSGVEHDPDKLAKVRQLQDQVGARPSGLATAPVTPTPPDLSPELSTELSMDTTSRPVAKPAPTPVTKRRWFKAVISVVAVLGAVSLVAGLSVGLTQNQGSRCPDGHTCTGSLQYDLSH